MSDLADAIARLRATLPADRVTSWRAHDALDDLERVLGEEAVAADRIAGELLEVLRELDQLCPDCRAAVEAASGEVG